MSVRRRVRRSGLRVRRPVASIDRRPAREHRGGTGLCLVPLFLAFVVVLLRIRSGPPFGPQPPYPAWAAFTMLPIWFVLVTIPVWAVDWSTPASSILPGRLGYLAPLHNLFWFGVVAVGLAGALLPGRRFLFTLSHLTVLEQRTRSAQQLVDGCHDMIAKGVSSPLADAEAALTRLTRERDTTRARFRAMGYRARFRHPGALAPWDPGTSS